jgi:DNA-binding GntR family transcriptional regulator
MPCMSLSRPDLKRSSPVPLKRQIVEHVTAAVASGDLRPGEKLPGQRELAEEWEVGYSTITDAVEELKAAGVLVASMGKGTFVAEQKDDA